MTSETQYLTVQADPVERMPDTPLPTEYWTFPIQGDNYLWSSLSSSWLQSSYDHTSARFNPYTTVPKSPHITWSLRNHFGGLEGGTFGTTAFHTGRSYESKNTPSILINNYFYQYGPVGDRVNSPDNELQCIDINTGEVVWSRAMTSSGVGVGRISLYGHIYRYDSANQQGLHAYLWYMGGSTWRQYDAFTGYEIMTWVNVTGGSVVTREDGTVNLLAYMLDTNNGWMACWNYTKACIGEGTRDGVFSWQSQQQKDQYGIAGAMYRPSNNALNDWSRGIEWNVTVPVEDAFGMVRGASLSWGQVSGANEIAVANSLWNDPVLVPQQKMLLFGYSLDPTNPGKIWGPVEVDAPIRTTRAISFESMAYIMTDAAKLVFYCYDLGSGELKWTSTPRTAPWGSYTDGSPVIAYNRLYSDDFDGLHCYDMDNGQELWFADRGNSGLETPYGTWITMGSSVVADGKVITRTTEFHNPSTLFRGEKMLCHDAFTGELLWALDGVYESPIVAQGHIIALNNYDGYFYDISKGPTSLTVEVGPKLQAKGTYVVIEGTVMDESPITKTAEAVGKYPNGVPAIADIFMSDWMDYLYFQKPKPMDAFGVPVFLQAMRVDDGTMVDIGEVYSDINGRYEKMWAPPTEGTWKILASFCGNDGYWGSNAETSLGVVGALSPATQIVPEDTTTTTTTTSAISTEVIIIAVVAIAVLIGAASYIALRKRK